MASKCQLWMQYAVCSPETPPPLQSSPICSRARFGLNKAHQFD
jgi:hypothetical protein